MILYRSAQSQRTVSSTASAGSGGLSRIPIKRNSSMRRKREIMENYVAISPAKTGHTSRAKMSTSSPSSANQQQHHDAAAGDTWSQLPLLNRRRGNNRAVAANTLKVTKSLERRGNRCRENANANISHSRSIGALNSLEARGGRGEVDPFSRSKLVKNSPKRDRRNKREEAEEQEVPKQADNSQQEQQLQVEKMQQPLAQVRSSPQSAPLAGVGAKSKVPTHQHSDSSGGGEYHNIDDMTVESISRLSTANSTISTLSYQVRRGDNVAKLSRIVDKTHLKRKLHKKDQNIPTRNLNMLLVVSSFLNIMSIYY